MTEKISRWTKFKRFLKRNITPLWLKRFTYQVLSLLISIAMVVGVAIYTFTKSYDERTLRFVDGFTITAHTGAYDTKHNSLEDVRLRPNGTVVMGHDLITTNVDGVEVREVFTLLSRSPNIKANLDIKDLKALPALYNLILEFNLKDRVFLTGIDYNQTATVREKCPGIDYYLNYSPGRIRIFSDDYQQKILSILEDSGAVGINCKYSYACGTLSELLHKNGYKLSVWTVDQRFTMKRILLAKPDNITTTKPTELKELIEHWGE